MNEVPARPRAVFWAPLLVRAILDEDATAPDNGATGAALSFRVDCIGESSWGEARPRLNNGLAGAPHTSTMLRLLGGRPLCRALGHIPRLSGPWL